MKIIDAHMHVGANVGRMVPDQSAEALISVMDKLGIEKCISAGGLTMRGRYEEGLAIDREYYEKSGGRIYSFFGYRPPYCEEAISCIRTHNGDPRFRGIKIHPSISQIKATDESYRACWEIAEEQNLPIMAHTWAMSSYNPTQSYATADLFEKWLREYPDVIFVFGHCGGRYNGIKDAIELGKKYQNAHFDITGDIWYNGFIEELVEQIGSDRIVYGSDYTMIEQRPMLGVVLGSKIPTIDKEKILYHTANRIYFGQE